MPKRILKGKVISTVENKTVKVLVQKMVQHRKYAKRLTFSTKYTAHDENNVCNVGDVVRIIECRPISKLKKWSVIS